MPPVLSRLGSCSCSAPSSATTGHAAAEKLLKDIEGVVEVGGCSPTAHALLQSIFSVPVVDFPFVVVRQDFVRVGYCFELLFGSGFFVDIRMKFARLLAVC